MRSNWVMLLVPALLVGCKANQESLDDYVKQVESNARQEVARLAPTKPYYPMQYSSDELRAPFVLPKEAVIASQPVVKKDCWQPAPRKRIGKLERFPLSQLRLKGVMGSGNSISGLVQTPKGTVVKVKNGNFLGQNNGRVIRIAPNFLLINETLPDGLGCWQKRKVKLALR